MMEPRNFKAAHIRKEDSDYDDPFLGKFKTNREKDSTKEWKWKMVYLYMGDNLTGGPSNLNNSKQNNIQQNQKLIQGNFV